MLTIAAFSYASWAADPEYRQGWRMLVNIPILAIPLVLLHGSIYLLVIGWRERFTFGQVSPRQAKIIHWPPASPPF